MKEIVFKTVVGIVLTATWGFCIAAIKKAHKRQKATEEGLQNLVEEGLKAQGADIEKALKAYEDRGYTAANAREELVADSMFDIFDRKTIQRLIGRMGTKDASAVAKAVDKVVNGLRDAFNQYADRYTDTREIVKLRGDIEKMEQIRSTFFKELRAASENFKNGVETSAEKQVQQFATVREKFEKQIDEWDGKTTGFSFVVGNTSEAMKEAGISNKQIRVDATKLKKTFADHPGIDKSVIKQMPDIIENPMLIMDSKTVDNSIVMLGDVYDKSGRLVTMAVNLNPTSRKSDGSITYLDIYKVSTYQGRSNIQSLINGSNIRYAEKNKNKLNEWLNVNRLQLPLRSFTAELNSSVTLGGENVNNKFSTARGVEETRDLIAVHNMQPDELRDTFALGGFPMPSIAIIKAKQGHSEYGTVSVVFNKDTIDPQKNRKNKVYGGDAWTPTFPHIEYKPNENVSKKISDTYYKLSREYGYDSTRPLYNYASDIERQLGNAGGETKLKERLYKDTELMRLYSLTNGKEIEDVYKENRQEMPAEDVETSKALIEQFGAEALTELRDGIKTIPNIKNFADKHASEIESIVHSNDINKAVAAVRKAITFTDNGGVRVSRSYDFSATQDKIIAETDQTGYKKWIDGLFTGIEEKQGLYNGKDYITNNGRRSWEALHYEVNLENIVKVMAQQANGEGALFSGLGIWGAAAKEYNSISEIKADKDRLQTIDEDEYTKLKQEMGSRLSEIAEAISDKDEDNSFIAIDNAMENICDAVRTQKTKSGIKKYLSQYHDNVTDNTVDDIVSLVNDIAGMPTGYFEAKPQRAVGYNEINAVVIPSGTDAELKKLLKDNNIKTVEYEADNEEDRLQKLNSLESAKFATARDSKYMDALDKYGENSEEVAKLVEQAAEDAGYSTRLYHGTPNGTFTVFKNWQYFTENKEYADVYQSQGASSNGYKATALNPKTYSVLLNDNSRIFDTRTAEAKKIFYDEFYGKYGYGADLSERGLPDWTDGDDLAEFLEENGYDYDVILVDEGGTGGYGDEVKDRGIGYIVKNSSQVKSLDPVTYDDDGNVIPLSERFNSEKEDIRYSTARDESIKDQLNSKSDILNKMNPVFNDNTEFKFTGKNDSVEWAMQFFKGNDYKINRKELGDIIIDRKRIRNGLRYLKTEKEITAFAAVEDVVKKGVIINRSDNFKGRNYNTVTIAAPIMLNGEKLNMAVVVRQRDGNYYKVHKIQLPDSSLTFEKERNNAERAGLTENGSGLSPADIVSDNTVSPSTENVNSKFSTPRDQVWSKDAKKLRAVKEQNAEYRRVVASQQKLINALQKQLSAIEGTTRFKDRRILKDRSLEMFAKRLIKETNSTMSTDALKERLAHIFDYTAGNSVDEEFGGYNENEAREAVFDLAMELINSSEINAATQMSQNGDDTFKTLCYLKCKNFLTTNQLFVKDF